MKRALNLLLVLCLLALPAAAEAGWGKHGTRSIHYSENMSFDVEDGVLVIEHETRKIDDRVTVTEDGDLAINGEKIEVDARERKLLKKFHAESLELIESAEAIAEDAERIASQSTAYAASVLARTLRALGDDDDEDVEELADLETDFEDEIEKIEEIGEEIGEQADEVTDLAEELRERIPELDELEWFAED